MPAVTFTTAPEQAQPVALFDRSLLSDEAQRQLTDLENELAFQFRRDAKNVYQIGSVLFHVRELIQADLKQKGIPSNQRDQGFKTWCEEQGLTRQSVYRYMSVYGTFKTCNNLLQAYDVPASVLYLLAQPSTPASIRKQFVAKWEQGDTITIQDVRDALAIAKGAKKRMSPLEFVGKIDEALDWWQKEKLRLEENEAVTDASVYPERKADYQRKLRYVQGRIDGLVFTQKLFACVQQGEHPLILCGDFPNEFSIEISEVAEKWGNFDEYAIEIEDVKGGQLG